jgi:peptide deformylase
MGSSGISKEARRYAKATLADGVWSHNHYTPAEMEELLARMFQHAIDDTSDKLFHLAMVLEAEQ